MNTSFEIDGLTKLIISTNPPRNSAQADNYVWIQVERCPIPTLDQMNAGVSPAVEVVASFGMRPGEARTIASALITAAQSAR